MEPLWNRQGATSGKRSARQVRKNGLSSDETVATSWHGKVYRATRERRDTTVARLTVARKIGKRAFHALRELELATT